MSEFLLSRLRKCAKHGRPIVSITAYDYFTALLAKHADVDFVLVGDSLGNVVQGAATTVGVSLDDVIYHTRIVCRHFPAERVILDMPFGTFKLEAEQTVENCVRAFKDGGCGGVKFEGANNENLFATRILTEAGVPVLGHLGLLPQRVYAEGGYKVQGKTKAQAEQLLKQAKALEQAGAFGIVLECVVSEVAARITHELSIPTIGIGSGNGCSGQIIVVHDILGMLPGEAPSFARQYADLFGTATQAVAAYSADVRQGLFPDLAMPEDQASLYGGDKAADKVGPTV
ncbi:3-methyl-2-oxobutanoate hydroxymethyltransferase [bacterium]|nr:3-methyl-2-oxobutanoate hydroxymethyltransferase [bacterium]